MPPILRVIGCLCDTYSHHTPGDGDGCMGCVSAGNSMRASCLLLLDFALYTILIHYGQVMIIAGNLPRIIQRTALRDCITFQGVLPLTGVL